MFRYEEAYTIKKMGEGLMSHMVLTDQSKYPGVEFQYGKVELIEEDDQLRVKFEYEVFENPNRHNTMTQKFRDYIGAILVDVIEQELTYANINQDEA